MNQGFATREQRISTNILRLARDVNGHYEQLRKLISPHLMGPQQDVDQSRRNLDAALYHASKLAEIALQTKEDLEEFHAMQMERPHVDRDNRIDFEAMYIGHASAFIDRFLSNYDAKAFLHSPSQQWLRAINEDFDARGLAQNLANLLNIPLEQAEMLVQTFRNKLSWRVRLELQDTPSWFNLLKSGTAQTKVNLVVQMAADDVFSLTLDVCNAPEKYASVAPILMAPDKFLLLADQRLEADDADNRAPTNQRTHDWSNRWTKLITSVLESFDYENGDYGQYVIHTRTVLNRISEDPEFNYAYEIVETLLSEFGKKHVLGDAPLETDSISQVARNLAIVEYDRPCQVIPEASTQSARPEHLDRRFVKITWPVVRKQHHEKKSPCNRQSKGSPLTLMATLRRHADNGLAHRRQAKT